MHRVAETTTCCAVVNGKRGHLPKSQRFEWELLSLRKLNRTFGGGPHPPVLQTNTASRGPYSVPVHGNNLLPIGPPSLFLSGNGGGPSLSPFRAKLKRLLAPSHPGDLATPLNRNTFRGGGFRDLAERAGA